MSKKIPVEGYKHMVRDAKSGAILNINKTGIEDARAAKARKKAEREEYEQMKNDIAEMKALLLKLVSQDG